MLLYFDLTDFPSFFLSHDIGTELEKRKIANGGVSVVGGVECIKGIKEVT